MFCMNCGQQIEDGAGFCPFCGAAQGAQQQNTQQQYNQQTGGQSNQQYQQAGQQYQQNQTPQTGGDNDTGSFWWAIPGVLLPLAGIIIFFVMRKDKPKTAKMAIIGAVVGIVVYLLFMS